MNEVAIDSPNANANTNLPARLTRFVGRQSELDLLSNLLLPNSPADQSPPTNLFQNPVELTSPVRIVTLTGTGGSGKTTLAVEVARRLVMYYPKGVWLIELAALSEPSRLAQAIISTLGVVESNELTANENLVNFLRLRQALLILDNCEHLIEEVARLVTTLSEVCPYLRILTTSQEALNVEGEQLWVVAPFSLPPFQKVPPILLDRLIEDYEAVAFFVERTRTVIPSFKLTLENANAVVQICRRLDGIPLALELAVTRLRVLSIEQLAARLESSFGVLTGGRRTALPRHQTLQATMDWSHSLLQEEEQILFRRLAVFAGGFTLEAAETIVTDEKLNISHLLDLLSRLVDKSLLIVEYPNKDTLVENDARRYRLLETVREYAKEKLLQSEEKTNCQRKLAAYYLEKIELIEQLLLSTAQQQIIKYSLLPELVNIRAALNWFKEQVDYEALLRIASSLWFFWLNASLVSEGREWIRVGLAGLGDRSRQSEPLVAAKALLADGQLAWLQGKQIQALRELTDSVTLYQNTSDQKYKAFSSGVLGLVMLTEDTTQAQALIIDSVADFRKLEDLWCLGNALLWLGNVKEAQKDYQQACEAYREAVDLFRELRETLLLPLALSFQAEGLFRLGDLAQAMNAMKESLELRRATGEKWYASLAVEILAQMVAELGHFEQAAVLYGMAEGLRGEISASVIPARVSSYAENLSLVRANLNLTIFEAGLNAGRKMNLSQLLEYLLTIEPVLLEAKATTKTTLPPPLIKQKHHQYSVSQAKKLVESLSQRELEILNLVARGDSSQEIADSLVITPGTVKWHLSNIFSKLDAKNRTQAVAHARAIGILDKTNH